MEKDSYLVLNLGRNKCLPLNTTDFFIVINFVTIFSVLIFSSAGCPSFQIYVYIAWT